MFSLHTKSGLVQKYVDETTVNCGPLATLKLEPGTHLRIQTGVRVARCAPGGRVVVCPAGTLADLLSFADNEHVAGAASDIEVEVNNASDEFIRVEPAHMLFSFQYVPNGEDSPLQTLRAKEREERVREERVRRRQENAARQAEEEMETKRQANLQQKIRDHEEKRALEAAMKLQADPGAQKKSATTTVVVSEPIEESESSVGIADNDDEEEEDEEQSIAKEIDGEAKDTTTTSSRAAGRRRAKKTTPK